MVPLSCCFTSSHEVVLFSKFECVVYAVLYIRVLF